MGRPKHFCEKPQDPYLQYVAPTTTTSTTTAPFESYIRYPNYTDCIDLSNIIDNVLPYYSGGLVLDFEGVVGCQFIHLETMGTPLSEGAIVSFGSCGTVTGSNVLLSNDSWQCLTSPGNIKILSGDIELIESSESCECGDAPPEPTTTTPPTQTTTPPTQTTTPPTQTTTTLSPDIDGSTDRCPIILPRHSTGYKEVYPDSVIVAFRVIPSAFDDRESVTFGVNTFRNNYESYNTFLTENASEKKVFYEGTWPDRAGLGGWRYMEFLDACVDELDYCVQSKVTQTTDQFTSSYDYTHGPIWELVELYRASQSQYDDLYTMNRWVGSYGGSSWLKDNNTLYFPNVEEFYDMQIEETQEYLLSVTVNLSRVFTSRLLQRPGEAVRKFLSDSIDPQIWVWTQERKIEDKINKKTYAEHKRREIVIVQYDSQYWNITDAAYSPDISRQDTISVNITSYPHFPGVISSDPWIDLNEGTTVPIGDAEAQNILTLYSSNDFSTFGNDIAFKRFTFPAVCNPIPWKDTEELEPRIFFPGLITYE
jgi:hypothetical protein